MVKLKREDDYKVLQRIEEKLDGLANTVAVTCEIVGRHDKDINGNGKPGLIDDVATLKSDVKSAKTGAIWVSAVIGAAWAVVVVWFKGGK